MESSNKEFIAGLTEILVRDKVLADEKVSQIVKEFANYTKGAFDEFLLSEGLVSKDDLLAALSKYYQVPALDVRGYFLDTGLIQSFPEEFLLHYAILPIEVDEANLIVVAANPDISGLAGKIEEYSSYVTEFRVGILQDIIDTIYQYYNESVLTDGHMHQLDAQELAEEADIDQFPDESI